ncbi:MAG TPA: MarR family winged helix-turn-helix transcriptional regulator [Candidatus Saccharimonadales bacterium]|nr:MarR family winged helix-turn-helix transcriptional regulator [Candidatus Saccharimonadales bacterium]
MEVATTNHYSLTSKQLAILNFIYRFRFITSDKLSKALNITKTTTNKRLKLLLELKYIGRKYEPEDRISRKHAIYYLLPGGIAELKKVSKEQYLSKVFRNIRNDENASDQFIKHNLFVLDTYLQLRSMHGEDLQFFTATQMAAKSYFPKPLPDAHIQLGLDKPKLFLLEVLHENQPFFLATRAIIRHIKYAQDGDWPSQYDFPKILLLCDSVSLQKRLLKKMRTRISESDSPKFYITGLEELKNDIWQNMSDPDETLSLSQI